MCCDQQLYYNLNDTKSMFFVADYSGVLYVMTFKKGNVSCVNKSTWVWQIYVKSTLSNFKQISFRPIVSADVSFWPHPTKIALFILTRRGNGSWQLSRKWLLWDFIRAQIRSAVWYKEAPMRIQRIHAWPCLYILPTDGMQR